MKINWFFLNYNKLPVPGVAPVPAFKTITHNFVEDTEIPRCPAITGYFKNTWLITSPVDITFQYKDNVLRTNSPYIKARTERDTNMLTMPLNYLFVCDESVLIESLPAFMHRTPAQTDLALIPGTVDIGQWTRTLDYTAQILTDKIITIRAGDPLWYIRFVTDQRVELNEITDASKQDELTKLVVKSTNYKVTNPGNSLQALYTMAKDWRQNS
jgi:hypothetical protein